MKLNTELVIDRSPEALWPWLDDPERMKQWMKGLIEVRATSPGPRGAGSTAIVVIREGRRDVEYEETFLEYRPGRRLKLRMLGGRLKTMAIEVDYELHDLGGKTRLAYELACDLQGPMLKLMSPLFGFFARMQLRRFFRRLKELAEDEGRLVTT